MLVHKGINNLEPDNLVMLVKKNDKLNDLFLNPLKKSLSDEMLGITNPEAIIREKINASGEHCEALDVFAVNHCTFGGQYVLQFEGDWETYKWQMEYFKINNYHCRHAMKAKTHWLTWEFIEYMFDKDCKLHIIIASKGDIIINPPRCSHTYFGIKELNIGVSVNISPLTPYMISIHKLYFQPEYTYKSKNWINALKQPQCQHHDNCKNLKSMYFILFLQHKILINNN